MIRIMCVTFVFQQLFISGESGLSESKWLPDLINYASENVYQMLLIADDNLKTYAMKTSEDIINEFKKKVPLVCINFDQTRRGGLGESRLLDSFQNPKMTLVMIMSYNPGNDTNFSQLSNPIEFLTRSSSTTTRPKCIFIFLSQIKGSSYEKFLRLMWKKLFLNVMVLEIVEEEEENLLQRQMSQELTFHYFNPFTKLYKNVNESQKLEWFPNKLQNLHGHVMNVGLFNLPPSVYVTRNSTGHIMSSYGIDVPIAKTLSQVMNFTMVAEPTTSENWGKFSCNKNNTDGINYKLMHNQIQFVIPRGFLSINYCNVSPTTDILYGVTSVKSLAPILKNTIFKLTGSWDLLYMLLAVLLFFFFVVFMLQALNLNMPSWQMFNVIQIMLGMSIPNELSSIPERVIFGWLLLTCTLYSSGITAILTDFNLDTENEMPMDNLNDLYNSDIKLISHIKLGVTKDYDEITWKLLNKSETWPDATSVCYQRLASREIISCLLIEIQAERLYHNFRDEDGDLSLKIISEPLFLYMEGMQLEPGSPYVQRFGSLISRMKQAGLYDKWKQDVLNNGTQKIHRGDFQMEEDDSTKVRIILISIALLGHLASFFVFLIEIVLFFNFQLVLSKLEFVRNYY